jgi:hypothetical protein
MWRPACRSSVCALVAGVSVAILGSACAQPVDLKNALRVADLTGGWFDAGIKDGNNRLVPTVTFRVAKTADVDVTPVQLNVVFKRIVDQNEEDWDEFFVQKVDFTEGNQTPLMTIRPAAGYVGESSAESQQSRAAMLKNSQFKDVRAIVFAKHSSATWVELARYDIPRQLLTH